MNNFFIRPLPAENEPTGYSDNGGTRFKYVIRESHGCVTLLGFGTRAALLESEDLDAVIEALSIINAHYKVTNASNRAIAAAADEFNSEQESLSYDSSYSNSEGSCISGCGSSGCCEAANRRKH